MFKLSLAAKVRRRQVGSLFLRCARRGLTDEATVARLFHGDVVAIELQFKHRDYAPLVVFTEPGGNGPAFEFGETHFSPFRLLSVFRRDSRAADDVLNCLNGAKSVFRPLRLNGDNAMPPQFIEPRAKLIDLIWPQLGILVQDVLDDLTVGWLPKPTS